VDPARGSDTTGDVCRELGIDYVGLDLHAGFNLLRDSLSARLQGLGKTARPDFCFFHPPYHNMILYSGNVWGEAHPDDLSRCTSPDDFLFKMEKSMVNIYDALRPEGHYAIMIADHRSKGEFRSYQADLIGMGIGKLKSVVIKAQHNCWSDSQQYSGNSFIPIKHEYIIVWAKDSTIQSIGALAMERSRKLSRQFFGTWRAVIEHVLRDLGGSASRRAIYERVGETFEATTNRNIEAKVRQTLNTYFEKVDDDTYALPVAA